MSGLDSKREKGEEGKIVSEALINKSSMICTLTDGAAHVPALVASAERRHRHLRGEPPPLLPVGRRRRRGIQRVVALRREGGRGRGRRTPRHRRVAHHCVGISERCMTKFVRMYCKSLRTLTHHAVRHLRLRLGRRHRRRRRVHRWRRHAEPVADAVRNVLAVHINDP